MKSFFASAERRSSWPVLRLPSWSAYALIAVIAALTFGAVSLAAAPPYLGVHLAATDAGDEVVVQHAPAGAGIPEGARVSFVKGGDGEPFALRATDVIEDPDQLPGYPEMDEFFARQARLYGILRTGEVELGWKTADGEEGVSTLRTGSRPLTDLPAVFWFQLAVGFVGLAISVWVFVLRPREAGARCFVLTGLSFPLSTTSAAIYSARELALPEEVFRLLSLTNHFGATAFGMALVALFAVYPQRLIHTRWLIVLPVVFVPWFLADALRLAPDLNWGVRIPLLIELGLAAGFAAWQWRASRGEPLARAALRWFVLSTLVGCSLFILFVPLYSTIGLLPPLSQGYAFGFFLTMYLGIALGLRRYRLFDIDRWAFRIAVWIAGAAAVIALDVALVLLGLQQMLSLGVAVLIAGWLYFPIRQWLWQRIVGRHEVRPEMLLPQLSGFAFLPDASRRERHWDEVLRRVFAPLEIAPGPWTTRQARVVEDGLALSLPAIEGLQPRTLRFADVGRRLFSTSDARLADTLCDLVGRILSGRLDHEQVVRNERQRLARDLHDNLGARLLRLIHHLRGSPDVELAREAMRDLRDAIAAIDAAPQPLSEALADWRAEADGRCAAAQVELRWHQAELPELLLNPRRKAALGAMLREAVTNALKHARPSLLQVDIGDEAGWLTLAVQNDGADGGPASWKEGYGLRSIRARLHDANGTMQTAGADGMVRLTLRVPMERLQA